MLEAKSDRLTEQEAPELPTWRKPEVQRLIVNLDTANPKGGSAADGGSFDGFVGAPSD